MFWVCLDFFLCACILSNILVPHGRGLDEKRPWVWSLWNKVHLFIHSLSLSDCIIIHLFVSFSVVVFRKFHHHHHHTSVNCKGHWGTTDDFATLPNSRPVHSLMLSSHLFLCLPCLLPSFTVPCKMVLARHDERETCPYHGSLRLFTIVRKSSWLGEAGGWVLCPTNHTAWLTTKTIKC